MRVTVEKMMLFSFGSAALCRRLRQVLEVPNLRYSFADLAARLLHHVAGKVWVAAAVAERSA